MGGGLLGFEGVGGASDRVEWWWTGAGRSARSDAVKWRQWLQLLTHLHRLVGAVYI